MVWHNPVIAYNDTHVQITRRSDEEGENKRNIAFISYVEGSHFGDVDIFFKEGTLSRDSTAISTCESHFFVLSRDSINGLRKQFNVEIDELAELAQKRQELHTKLINNLKDKILKIREQQ